MDYLKTYQDFIKINNLEDIQRKIRNFYDENKNIINDNYNKAKFPKEIIPKLRALNFGSGNIKSNYTNSISDNEFLVVVTELSKYDLSLATFMGVQMTLVFQTINNLGSEFQKEKYLKKLANFECIGSFGLTEPNHGSDIIFLETNFRKENDYYILNGNKRWIGNATFADFVIIFARNIDNPMDIGIFIVDTKINGLDIKKIKFKSGLRLVENADIIMENVIVGKDYRMPARNFKDINKTLMPSRFFVGVSALGALMGSYEKTFNILKNKTSFYNPLLSYQIQQYKLIDVQMKLDSCILVVLKSFELFKKNKLTHGQASFVKALVTKEARNSILILREMIGGNGILYDIGIGKMLSDIEILYTYEGTYDINVLIAAKDITGLNGFAKL